MLLGRVTFEGDATDVGRLRLLECRPFHSGVVLTRYTANE